MDKFEYELKVEQIEKLIGREDYSTAKKIADTMEWKREKDPKLLTRVAELYAQAGDIEKALKIYNYAYNVSSRGLLILERMTELALIFGQLDLAEELCEEYRSAGAYDADYYLFKFQIAESKGEDLDKRISWLEKYCAKELDEEALYRLAWMYDRAERKDDCIRICDYIIDFFCFGESVEHAIALKQNYEPLTKYQERRVTDAARYEENYQHYIENLEEENRRERKEKRHEEQIREDALMEKEESALGKQISEIVKQNEIEKQEVHLDGLVADEELMASLAFSGADTTAAHEIEPEAEEEIQTEQEAEPEVETEPEPEVETEPELGDEAEIEPEVEEEVQTEPETEDEIQTEPEGEEESLPEVILEAADEEAEEGEAEAEAEVHLEDETEPEAGFEEATEEIVLEAEEAFDMVGEPEVPEVEVPEEPEEKDAAADDAALEQILLQNIEENLQESLKEEIFAVEGMPDEPADDSPEDALLEALLDGIEEDAEDAGNADEVQEEPEKAQDETEPPIQFTYEEENGTGQSEAETAEAEKPEPEQAEAEQTGTEQTEAEQTGTEQTETDEAEAEPELEPRTRRKGLKRTSELSALDLVVPEGSFKVACSDIDMGVKYALELVRMVPEEERCDRVAKIGARRVNKAKFAGIEQQLDHDILLITNAGQLTNSALESIYTWMKKSMENRLILVDTQEQLDSLEKRKPKLMKRFTEAYVYEKKDTQEWLELVDSYADENDCVLADDAYQLFEEYLRDKEEKGDVVLGVNLKDAVQDALHQATRFSFSNMLSSILNTKYDDDGLLILRDRHFR